MAKSRRREQAENYLIAGNEHLAAAQHLYQAGRFVLSNYVAGLSVECVLRAYRHMIDPAFDSGHDLLQLHQSSKFETAVPENLKIRVGIAITTVVALWANDHRFASERWLRAKLKRMKLDRGIRGDFLKERTRQLINAATDVVTIGVVEWTRCFGN